MKTSVTSKLALAAGLALSLSATSNVIGQHAHLNVGAIGTNQNDPLIWANGPEFAPSSGFVKTLDSTNAGRYSGYFQQNITLTVLPVTPPNSGPDPAAPALGSFIFARMTCLEAPPGGAFGFWENGATSPTAELTAGQIATQIFPLSEGSGLPGADPYGHFHGRRFTATRPGLYKISFQASDLSTNGANGGPIHTPSAPLTIWFQAGVNFISIDPNVVDRQIRFELALPRETTWQIEINSVLGSATGWEAIGTPIVGNDLLVEKFIESTPVTPQFYRLRRTAP